MGRVRPAIGSVMRRMFAGTPIVICVFMLCSVLLAENQMRTFDRDDKYKVNFFEKVRVADRFCRREIVRFAT
jgi:hypothetical protein